MATLLPFSETTKQKQKSDNEKRIDKRKDAAKFLLSAIVQQLVFFHCHLQLKDKYQRISTTNNEYEASCCWAHHQQQKSFHCLTKQLNRKEGRTPSDIAVSTNQIYCNLQTDVRRRHLILSQQSMIGSGLITRKFS